MTDERATALLRRAGDHRAQGRPRAALAAYRLALDVAQRNGARADEAAIRAEYASLLVQLGRDREAADVVGGAARSE